MNIDSLLAALASAQLLTTMSMEEARARALEHLDGLLDGPDAAALVLVKALDQPIPGVVSHDFHFWNETDDVVAEFAAAIHEPEALRLELLAIETYEERMHVRATVRGEAREQWIELDGSVGGLDAFAAYLNALLAEIGAAVRVYALDTAEFDWHVFVVRTPAQMSALASGGWTRPLRDRG